LNDNDAHDFDSSPGGTFFDRTGQQISAERAGELYALDDYRVVAFDEIDGGAGLSCRLVTAWLGIDMSAGRGGPPLIFATRVIGGFYNGRSRLYPNLGAATNGHIGAMVRLSAGKAPGFGVDLPACPEIDAANEPGSPPGFPIWPPSNPPGKHRER
jgi:hypothetical protein